MSKDNLEEAAKKIVETQEGTEQESTENHAEKTSLGNINEIRGEEKTNTVQMGHMEIYLEELPSQGMFYPEGTKIHIKAAGGAEIKHWSTINAEDDYDIDMHLNDIIDKCVKISIPGQRATSKDIKEIDRFWLIFAIREYTFKDGENKLTADVKGERVEINKDIINYFNPSEKLMRFYNEEKKCFTFNLNNGESVDLHFPSRGITDYLKNKRVRAEQSGEKIDEDFARYSLFLFQDWRGLNDDTYKNEEMKSAGWSLQKTSLVSKFVDLVKDSVNPSMTVKVGAEEVTVPLNFRGGIKAIFIIPDILDELI